MRGTTIQFIALRVCRLVQEEFVDWLGCAGGRGKEKEKDKEKDDQVVLTMKFPLS